MSLFASQVRITELIQLITTIFIEKILLLGHSMGPYLAYKLGA